MTWGHQGCGGDSSGVQAELKTGVDIIYSTERSFCAQLVNGGIVTWGHERWGGDSSGVQAELKTGVDTIYSTSRAFVRSWSTVASCECAPYVEGPSIDRHSLKMSSTY